MIEILGLVFVIFALCGLIAWLDWNNRKERSKLINAIIAQTPEQLRDLEFVEKFQPAKMTKTDKKLDLVPVDKLSDEEFADLVGGQN